MSPKPIVMDVDTGVDDALAILLAFRSPELQVQGITTVHGNVGVEASTANTLIVLDLAQAPPTPVVAGAARPLRRSARTAGEVHGLDGLGDLSPRPPVSPRQAGSGAHRFLLDQARKAPGRSGRLPRAMSTISPISSSQFRVLPSTPITVQASGSRK